MSKEIVAKLCGTIAQAQHTPWKKLCGKSTRTAEVLRFSQCRDAFGTLAM